ncbi:kinase-like domain-containing protein [Paraphoma chrysanthemicola]|nr:kinase-like domain-containing protein [Paraphoma chrysanthemicola]
MTYPQQQISNNAVFRTSNLAMDPVKDLLPVFQYRNWLVKRDDNDDNIHDNSNDDNNSLQSDYLSQSVAVAIASQQGCNATSSLGGLPRSAGSDNRHVIQWETGIDAFQEHTSRNLDASISQELVPSSSEQMNNDMITFLRMMNTADEPWNPLASSLRPLVTPSPIMYILSYFIGPEKGAPSIYHTATSEIVTNEATSEIVTNEAFHSTTSRLEGYRNAVLETVSAKSVYLEMLRERGLWPVDPQSEQNWSGEGQHVEFKKGDIGKINKLLTVEKLLGSGSLGFVHKVKCRRISMARKTIYTKTPFRRETAIREVEHMARLKHSHIIRLIGTYVCMREFCILMYPVANGNLEMFLGCLGKTSPEKIISDEHPPDDHLFDTTQVRAMAFSLRGFFSCLSSAMRYIHGSITKHMDIKPSNILVQSRWQYRGGRPEYSSKVYISDFDISRSYETIDAANTDGKTSCTRKYASPEVDQGLIRGLSADIFSLGCVFLEMFAALDSYKVERSLDVNSRISPGLQESRDTDQASCKLQEELKSLLISNNGSKPSYQGNLASFQELLKARIPNYEKTSIPSRSTLEMILNMIQSKPEDRPTAAGLVQEFGEKSCCIVGPDELEVEDRQHANSTERSLEVMMKERKLQQSGGSESNQEQIEAAPFQKECVIAGLNEDSNSLRMSGREEVFQSIDASLLLSGMGMWE